MPVETTVNLGKGQRAGRLGASPEEILAAARESALAAGLGEEGARVVQSILRTEGGLQGAVGDLDGGGSYSPLQLYWGGELGNLAAQLGVSKREAAEWAQANPTAAVDWGIRTYLGGAIRDGMRKGLAGPDLATYAQAHGQRSVHPERAGQQYVELFPTYRRDALPASQLASIVRPVVQTVSSALTPATAEAAEADPPTVRVYRNGQEIDPSTPPFGQGGGDGVAQVSERPAQTPGLEGGGGASATPPSAPVATGSMTADDFRALLAKHGGAISAPTILDQPKDEEIAGVKTGDKLPTPNPRLRFVTKDGKTIVVKQRDDGDYDVVEPGTLLAADAAASKPTKPIVRQAADGTIWSIDPNTGQATPVEGPPARQPTQKPTALTGVNDTDEFITVMDPDGTIRSEPNPTYNPTRARETAATRAAAEQRAANVDARAQAMLPGSLESQAAQAALARAQAKKALDELIPKQQKLIQDHLAVITQLQGLVASGQMTPQQADQYVRQSQQSLEAGLRGATPYLEQQAQQAWQEHQQTTGASLLNQRLSSGASLAANLMSGAGTLAQSAMSMPGHRITYDPTQLALALTDRLGGGEGMSALARAMIEGSNPMPSGLGPGTPAGLAAGPPPPAMPPAAPTMAPPTDPTAPPMPGAGGGLAGPPAPPAPPMPGDPRFDPRLIVGGLPPPYPQYPGMPA